MNRSIQAAEAFMHEFAVPFLTETIADGEYYWAEKRVNYRQAFRPEQEAGAVPPRCGEHRDFGGCTLVVPDDSRACSCRPR